MDRPSNRRHNVLMTERAHLGDVDERTAADSPAADRRAFANLTLVENESLAPQPEGQELEPYPVAQLEEQLHVPVVAALEAPTLMISRENIQRGIEVRDAFDRAGPDSDVGARLLEEFVAGEVPIVRELQNVEGALGALLGRTVMGADLHLALKVAEVLRETVALSSAVRKRAETSLAAVAGLRAQRAFISSNHQRTRGCLGE